MKNIYSLFISLLFFSIHSIQAQEPVARFDSICVNESDLPTFSYDLTLNDSFPSGQLILQDPNMCWRIVGNNLVWIGTENCRCGETYYAFYYYENNPYEGAEIEITIKCDVDKPECFLNNLADVPDPSTTGQASCLYACEYSTATYFWPHVSGNTYTWAVTGDITHMTNVIGNEIHIEWGPTGPGNINLTVTNGGSSTTTDFCVDILDAPVADFSATTDCICLNGSISFMNNSIGASSFLWDFGDGETSVNPNPTHEFDNPGTYTVILYAFNNNQDPKGDPLCCCSDSTSLVITVEDDPGPDIYWISTLCPGDKSWYWTDAVGCGTYTWEVRDENGNIHPFTPTANGDSICVTWGGGPFGTISLGVTGCSATYCSKPSVVLVPIISAVSAINGDDEVCVGATEVYTLPKWPNVYYNWTVTGGTLQPGDNGHNTVTINWGTGPVGTIHVDYHSEFLGGLPGHNQSDCAGVADLTVSILPAYTVSGPVPRVACVNSSSNFSATSIPSSNYNWTVTPAAPITGNGTANITVDWSSGPGTFVVMAVTNDPALYCNDSVTYVMTIIEVPTPDSIVGPKKICPNETATYLGYSSTPNTTLEWTVQNGSPSTYTGSPITVTWGPSGPYAISLAQMQAAAPMCLSDTISCELTEKAIDPDIAFSASDACINTQQVYSTPNMQDEDAVLEWKVSPTTAGSVISGQGTLNPTVQWNNDPGPVTLTYSVTLCGQTLTHTESFMLHAPAVPTITQVGDLCPGQTAELQAPMTGFNSYQWVKSGSTIGSMYNVTISTPGTYELTTEDANGCFTTVSIDVFSIPGPVASISTPDSRLLCWPNTGLSTTLYAQTNPNYIFTWYCNGSIAQGPSPMPTFTHFGTNATQTYAYYVEVLDIVTQCTSESNVIIVTERECMSQPDTCMPANHTFSISSSNPTPSCNVANFTVSASPNVSLGSWNFGDPLSNTNAGTTVNAEHTYSKAGYYTASINATVPNLAPPPPSCILLRTINVCIPLAVDFSFEDNCQEVCFTDLSTFLPGHDITDWMWSFGDGNTSIMQNPCHPYSAPGTYLVELTVKNASLCEITYSEWITITGPSMATVNINPNPACVGDPVDFTATGTNIIDWLWDFGDMSTNGSQNPSHTYLTDDTYLVRLITTDNRGCKDTVDNLIIVHPNPMMDTISYSPSLIICEGESVTLTAPAGYPTYNWSNAQVGPSINVSTSGDYHVTVTDAQGCMMVTDPVTVVVVPPPAAEISGPNYICDEGCVTLSATAGAGYSYQWLDAAMDPLLPGDTNQTYDVCDFMVLPMTVYVLVTDPNGCSTKAGPHTVGFANSPTFSISHIGDLCEGSPNILSVPTLPDVRYQWSTGETGLSITVILAGQYTVIGTDTITGCSSAESITINPLPDLCIVPTGCYKVCDPDTLCGPDGLTAYQWNMNGMPIPGATDQCYIVTASGSYSLTGTNEFNCSLTSDTLILEVMPCTDCEDQEVTANFIQGDGCCWSLSYFNTVPDAYGLMMHTGDANITPDLGSLDPSLSVFTIGSNYIGLVANGGGNLPVGGLTGYLDFCLTNITNVPQTVIFDWYNDSLDIVCSDTLIFDCPKETDCIYISHDTIYCGPNDQVIYEFTVCNSILNTFTFNYLSLVPSTPPGIVVSPDFFNLSPGLVPGACTTLTVTLSGSNIANQEYCFNAIGHLSDPAEDPDALCCSLDTLQCIDIPGCTPCDNVYLEPEQLSDDPCCYAVHLNNNLGPNIFSGVQICALTPGTELSIDNPFGSDWLTSSFSPTMIDLAYNGTSSLLPLGVTSLPKICIDKTNTPTQLIEIKWMKGTSIVCRDTFVAACEPPCGYIYNDTVYCTENNQWVFEGYIKNTSAHTMSTAVVSFVDATLTGYNQTINLGSLPPGGTFGPFYINIGAPASAGQVVCVDVILHEVGHNNQHENCCVFRHCIELPDCGGTKPCLCDQDFEEQVSAGFTCNPGPDFQYFFSPIGNLTLCDQARWTWDDGSPATTVVAPTSVLHQFPGPGSYEVCMTVFRYANDGNKCKARFCKEVEIHENRVSLSPNPAHGTVNLEWNVLETGMAKLRLYSPEHVLVQDWQQEISDTNFEHNLNLDEIAPGLYFIIMELNGHQWIEKLMVY